MRSIHTASWADRFADPSDPDALVDPGEDAPAESRFDMARAFGDEPGAFGIGVLASLNMAVLAEDDLVTVLSMLESQAAWLSAVTNRALVALRDIGEAVHASAQRPSFPGSSDEWAAQDRQWDREELRLAQRIGDFDARRRLETAIALRDRLPATAQALESGQISWRHADAIAAETTRLDARQSAIAESRVLGDPRRVTVHQFRVAARRHAAALNPIPVVEQALDASAARSIRAWQYGDGSGELHAVLTADGLATVTTALTELAGSTGPDDHRTVEQRRADALVDLCAAHLTGASCTSRSARPLAHLVIDVPLASLIGLPDSPPVVRHSGPSGFGGSVGQPLAPSTLQRLSCDALITRLITDPATGAVLDLGRTTRVPDARLRRAVEIRDGRSCTFPGCQRRRDLHAHHIEPWTDAVGPTDQHNLTLLCPRHHHAVHDAAWTIHRDRSGQLTWTSPAGQHHRAPVEAWRPDPDPPWPALSFHPRRPGAAVSRE
jgi:hypothetical protein